MSRSLLMFRSQSCGPTASNKFRPPSAFQKISPWCPEARLALTSLVGSSAGARSAPAEEVKDGSEENAAKQNTAVGMSADPSVLAGITHQKGECQDHAAT